MRAASSAPVPKILAKVRKTKQVRSRARQEMIERLSKAEHSEIAKLNACLPPAARLANPGVEPVQVLNDTVSYIDHLMTLIVARVNQGTLPPDVLHGLPVVQVPTSPPQQKGRLQRK